VGSLAEKVEITEDGKKVIVPRELWEEMLETLEDYGLLKAMEEAEKTPLLTKEEALDYLEKLGRDRVLIYDYDGNTYQVDSKDIGLWNENQPDSPVAFFADQEGS